MAKSKAKLKRASAVRLYWNDVRALSRSADIKVSEARRALRDLRYDQDGGRVNRANQAKAYRKVQRAKGRKKREYQRRKAAAEKQKRGKIEPFNLKMVDLYEWVKVFAKQGFLVSYTSPFLSGDIPKGTPPIDAESHMRQLREAGDRFHAEKFPLDARRRSQYWRVEQHFTVTVKKKAKTVNIVYFD